MIGKQTPPRTYRTSRKFWGNKLQPWFILLFIFVVLNMPDRDRYGDIGGFLWCGSLVLVIIAYYLLRYYKLKTKVGYMLSETPQSVLYSANDTDLYIIPEDDIAKETVQSILDEMCKHYSNILANGLREEYPREFVDFSDKDFFYITLLEFICRSLDYRILKDENAYEAIEKDGETIGYAYQLSAKGKVLYSLYYDIASILIEESSHRKNDDVLASLWNGWIDLFVFAEKTLASGTLKEYH